MSIVISPIAIEHTAGFQRCLDTVARERRYLAQTEALPLEKIEPFVRDSVARDKVQFVALDDADVVGWADIFSPWQQSIAHCGSLGMGVHPGYRRRGIGEALLSACLAKAKMKGITRIELEARVDNLPAIRLYEKLGFVHEAVKRHAMRFDGVYFDAVQMCLLQP